MGARWVIALGLIVLAPVSLGAQATIEDIPLQEALSESQLTGPVYEGVGVAPVAIGAFTAAYDRDELFVRRGGGNLFTRGPEYRLDQNIDILAMFEETLRSQAGAMGLRPAADGDTAWQVSGTVHDLYLESRQVPYGSTLFYSYADIELQIDDPTGTRSTVRWRFHHYFQAYNAGLGRRDEAALGAATFLVEGAQELVARLNRAYLHAPPQAAMAGVLETLRADDIENQDAALRAVGLSGLEAAVPRLLGMLALVDGESERGAVIDALALLGSPQAVSVLSSRYADEDEDCRWYTLKAMDYIGTDEALALVADSGVDDDDDGPKRLARRITGG